MSANDKYGPFPKDSSPLKRRCRLLQSWYRVEVLGIRECGPQQVGAKPVCSSLVNGEQSGANFLSPAAFAYARERVADKENNPDLVIDEFRLFNNMLSSQPMCFNLFADFRVAVKAGRPDATEILRSIFRSSQIQEVEDVVVEMIPRPTSDYIDDKTAFDAAFLFVDTAGKRGLASIETKYTDSLGGNRASKEEKKFGLAKDLGLFTDEGLSWHEANGFDQVARNLLLTFAYTRMHALNSATNYVLAPRDDEESPSAVRAIQDRIAPEHRGSIVWLPLEELIERGLLCAKGAFADHLTRFRQRYLDFSQIAHLENGASSS